MGSYGVAILQKPSSYIIQQASLASTKQALQASVQGAGQQNWVQTGQQQVAFRAGSILQAQPQAQPSIIYTNTRPNVVQQQPNLLTKQATASPVHIVQVAQNRPPAQLQVLAGQQQSSNIVYVNINGVLQRGIIQNGSVILINEAAAPGGSTLQTPVQAPTTQGFSPAIMAAGGQQALAPVATVSNGAIHAAAPQFKQQQPQQLPLTATKQQSMTMQQLVPANNNILTVGQGPVRGPTAQQSARPMMTLTMPGNSLASQQQQPVVMVMQQGPLLPRASGPMAPVAATTAQLGAARLAAPGAPSAAVSGSMGPAVLPLQQFVPRGSTAQVCPQTRMQPQLLANLQNQMLLKGNNFTSTVGCQQSSSAFRPAVAAGAKLLVPGMSVSASTASMVSKRPAVGNQGPAASMAPAEAPTSGITAMAVVQNLAGAAGQTAAGSDVVVGVQPGVVHNLNTHLSADVNAVSGMNQRSPSALPPPLNLAATSAPTQAMPTLDLMALLCQAEAAGMNLGKQGAPAASVITGVGKDSYGTAAVAKTHDGISPPVSTAGSQPGTPMRSSSGGGTLSESSSTSSMGLPVMHIGESATAASAAAAAPVAAAACTDSGKAAIMRLVARSFIETGIFLQQALAMIQPSDRDLLTEAFNLEAATQVPSAYPVAEAKPDTAMESDACSAPAALAGSGSLGGEKISMPPPAAAQEKTWLLADSGWGLGTVVAGVAGLDSSSINNGSSNFGNWGFSLFSGGTADLSGSNGSVGAMSGQADQVTDTAVWHSRNFSVSST